MNDSMNYIANLNLSTKVKIIIHVLVNSDVWNQKFYWSNIGSTAKLTLMRAAIITDQF